MNERKAEIVELEKYASDHDDEINGMLWAGVPVREMSHLALLGIAHHLFYASRKDVLQRIREQEVLDELRRSRSHRLTV